MESTEDGRKGIKLAPYNPTNIEAIGIALNMLQITSEDVVYDLGCGDGRFLIEACRSNSHIRCVGIEYDLKLSELARANIEQAGFTDRISILHDNVINTSLSEATVLFVYLVPQAMKLLTEAFSTFLSETRNRIVTYVFSIPTLTPAQVEVYKGSTKIYLYLPSSLPVHQLPSSSPSVSSTLLSPSSFSSSSSPSSSPSEPTQSDLNPLTQDP